MTEARASDPATLPYCLQGCRAYPPDQHTPSTTLLRCRHGLVPFGTREARWSDRDTLALARANTVVVHPGDRDPSALFRLWDMANQALYGAPMLDGDRAVTYLRLVRPAPAAPGVAP